MTGFYDRTHLSKLYVERFGITPASFRRQSKIIKNEEFYMYLPIFNDDAMIRAQDTIGLQRFANEKNVRAILDAPTEFNIDSNLRILKSAIAKNPSGIMVSAYNAKFIPLLKEATNKGIPVITVDGTISSPYQICEIRSNWSKIGETLAVEISDRIPVGSGIAVFALKEDTTSTSEATRSINEILKQRGNYVCVIQDDGSNIKRAELLVYKTLLDFPEIKGFIGLDNNSAFGICTALKNLKRKNIVVVALDNTKPNMQLLDEGYISALICQRRELFAYYGGLILYDAVHSNHRDQFGRPIVPSSIDTGIYVITSTNKFII
jgi:ribose transport system substrate-binding protein